MRHNLACDSREYGATVLIIQPGGSFPETCAVCAGKCLCCARFRSGRGSREIIGKRKSSSAPGSNSSRSSSHQAGAEARRPRVRAPLRLETLLLRTASRRGLLRTLLSLRGANALPPSASAWPTRPSRSRGRTPAEPSPHAAVRGLDAREHTACGPPSAARPPPPGREGLGRGSPPGQARHGRARHGPARTRVRVRPSWV